MEANTVAYYDDFSYAPLANVSSPQAISFTSSPPGAAVVGGSYAVAATGGASGNPVTFSTLTPGTCTVTGGVVEFVGSGSCTIGANQAGNLSYSRCARPLSYHVPLPVRRAL